MQFISSLTNNSGFFLYIVYMSRRLLHIIFPENVAHIYVDGRKYTRKEFTRAKPVSYTHLTLPTTYGV